MTLGTGLVISVGMLCVTLFSMFIILTRKMESEEKDWKMKKEPIELKSRYGRKPAINHNE